MHGPRKKMYDPSTYQVDLHAFGFSDPDDEN